MIFIKYRQRLKLEEKCLDIEEKSIKIIQKILYNSFILYYEYNSLNYMEKY